MFSRTISATLHSACFEWKVIILTWPRQVGKTTLIETLLWEHFADKKIARYFGEHIATQTLFASQDFVLLRQSLDAIDIIFIDEGQKIQNIGETLKLLIDYYKNTKQIIITGSSSFHLLDQVSESLAGRKRVYTSILRGISGYTMSTSDTKWDRVMAPLWDVSSCPISRK